MARSNEPKDEAEEARMGRPQRNGGDAEFSNRDWAAANAPTDPERRRRLRERLEQTHLPNLPFKEGWHRCWVSTSHSTDTIATRLNFGYRLLSKAALQEEGAWNPHQHSSKDADSVDDKVVWREMIGMELPEDLYQELMRELHHDLPRDRAQAIYDPLAEVEERIRDSGGSMQMGEGFKEMGRFRRAPKQFE
jgi:hypothetical protein